MQGHEVVGDVGGKISFLELDPFICSHSLVGKGIVEYSGTVERGKITGKYSAHI